MPKKNLKCRCPTCDRQMRKDNLNVHINSCVVENCPLCGKFMKKTRIKKHVMEDHPVYKPYTNARYHQWLRNRNIDTSNNQIFHQLSQTHQQYLKRYTNKYYWVNPANDNKYDLNTAKSAYLKQYRLKGENTRAFYKNTKTGVSFLYFNTHDGKWETYVKRIRNNEKQ